MSKHYHGFVFIVLLLLNFCLDAQQRCASVFEQTSPNVIYPQLVELANDLQFDGLQHLMSQDNFYAALHDYALRKGSETKVTHFGKWAEDGVYLGLIPHDRFTRPLAQGTVTLIFSNHLMARNDYLVNIGWKYGKITRESAKPENFWKMMIIMQKIARNSSKHDVVPRNEVVFKKPISFNDLIAIYVHPDDYEQTIEKLNQHPNNESYKLIRLIHTIHN